jgi:NADPH2:quinone reductase
VLFHAAAGGVGLIACQWARALGLQLIGTAGGAAKCRLALEHGAAHAIDYTKEDFVARVKDITGGKGVKVVYDSIGKDTFEGSLNCLRPFGLLASFGNASGPVPPFAPGILGQGLAVPHAGHAVHAHRHARGHAAHGRRPVRRGRQSGQVKIRIDQRYPGRGGAGAPRPRGTQDHRVDRAAALNQG